MTREKTRANKQFWKGVAIIAALFCCAPSVWADEVTLTNPDDGFVISGEFLGFDGDYLRLDSIYGPLTVDYNAVDCVGEDCPNANDIPIFRLSGSPALGGLLLPALIESYARQTPKTSLSRKR